MNSLLFKSTLFVVAPIVLWGCGEGEDKTASQNKEKAPVSASDGLTWISPNRQDYVNLAPYVTSGMNGAKLLEVVLTDDNPNCGHPTPDVMGFYTTIIDSAMCDYEYSVQSVANENQLSTQGKGNVLVVSSSSGEPLLPPVIVETVVGKDNEINLSTLLGNDFPAGYTLQPGSELLGVGLITDEHADLSVIDYTSDSEGVARIVYTLVSPDGVEADTKVGSVNVAVSSANHQPPIANNFTHDDTLELGTVATIDVQPHVVLGSGSEFQLIDVDSFNANTTITNPNDIYNKQFDFSGVISGSHYVAYSVYDHLGGYSTAIAEVEAHDPHQDAQWEYLVMSDGLYSAPLTSTEALEQNVQFTGNHYDGGYQPAISMATFNYDDATGYCSTMGALPTSAQLSALYHHHDPDNQNWPTELEYLTDDSGSPMAIDFVTGNITLARAEQGYYVTCNTPGNLTITTVNGTAVADGSDEATVEVTAMMDFDGNGFEPVADVVIDASVDGSAQLNESSVPTDSNGKALFEVTNYKAESVNVSAMATDVSSRALSVSATVEFIADSDTAELTELTVIENFAMAGGVEAEVNTLKATVTDANHNTVGSALVDVTTDSNTALIQSSSSLYTNEDGTVNIDVTNIVGEDVNVTVSHTSVDVGTSALTKMITFVDLAGPYIDIFDTGNGKLFTSSPSVPYLDSIGGSATNGTLTEIGIHGPVGDFYLFDWSNANALCNTYNTQNLGGRTNWRLSTIVELEVELFDAYGNMFPARGWPVTMFYWSSTPDVSVPSWTLYYFINLSNSDIDGISPHHTHYVSCVSEP